MSCVPVLELKLVNVAISSQVEFATLPRILIQVLLLPACHIMSISDGTSSVIGSLGEYSD